MDKTTDGVVIRPGMIVYYIDSRVQGEQVRSHMIMMTPLGPSINNHKPLGGVVYSTQKQANNFKKYLWFKRGQKFKKQFVAGRNSEVYRPSKEV